MRAIHGLLAILLSIAIFLPITAQAQSRASSYAFAPSTHSVTDKNTSMVGYVFDDFDSFCDNFRDTRGVMMFIVCAGLAVMMSIAGLPFAALMVGMFAGFILLLNKPMLFGIALVPIYLVYRQSQQRKKEELRLAVEPKLNESAESLAIRRARKARKLQKKSGAVRSTGSRTGITARAS